MQNYLQVRDRIFKDFPQENTHRKSKRSTLRLRRFWKAVRENKKLLISSVLNEEDARYYAKVKLLDREIYGLLDTGANISCMGSSLASETFANRPEFCKLKSTVKTADGKSHAINGFLSIDIEYKTVVKKIKLYIIPSIKQELILGVDFWKIFNLAPNIIGSVSADNSIAHEKSNDIAWSQDKTSVDATRLLTKGQRQQLEAVKSLFPNFKTQGLGRTTLLNHDIDVSDAKPVKQRFYPVSPAVEKLMYQEVDRMFRLGVRKARGARRCAWL